MSDFRNQPAHCRKARFAGRAPNQPGDYSATGTHERAPEKTERSASGRPGTLSADIQPAGHPPALPIIPRLVPSPLQPELDPAAPPATSASATPRAPTPAANRNSNASPTDPFPSTYWTPAPHSTLYRLPPIVFHSALPHRMSPPNSLMLPSGFSYDSSSQTETARCITPGAAALRATVQVTPGIGISADIRHLSPRQVGAPSAV